MTRRSTLYISYLPLLTPECRCSDGEDNTLYIAIRYAAASILAAVIVTCPELLISSSEIETKYRQRISLSISDRKVVPWFHCSVEPYPALVTTIFVSSYDLPTPRQREDNYKRRRKNSLTSSVLFYFGGRPNFDIKHKLTFSSCVQDSLQTRGLLCRRG
ncbi:hypothetical protein EDC04DRAFT_2705126 [Pisolithus marmoratus]|nr:hypothetical protein EDC04DRAFT_2705126 [Pisolithus marmoratus]